MCGCDGLIETSVGRKADLALVHWFKRLEEFWTMNASALSQQTVAEQRSHEPSMEEILASIRRIIADDHVLPLSRSPAAPVRQPQAEPPRVQAAQHDDYDDYEPASFVQHAQPLRQAAPLRPPQPQAYRDAGPQRAQRPVHRMEEPAARMAPEPQMRPFEAPHVAHDDLGHVDATIVSHDADASVSSSFNALATSVMLQNSGLVEDSIREMLRPMLKGWLDDNLPGIVERLVRQEIERMARGRR